MLIYVNELSLPVKIQAQPNSVRVFAVYFMFRTADSFLARKSVVLCHLLQSVVLAFFMFPNLRWLLRSSDCKTWLRPRAQEEFVKLQVVILKPSFSVQHASNLQFRDLSFVPRYVFKLLSERNDVDNTTNQGHVDCDGVITPSQRKSVNDTLRRGSHQSGQLGHTRADNTWR